MGEWYGVTTTRRGRVIGVELSMNGNFRTSCEFLPQIFIFTALAQMALTDQ